MQERARSGEPRRRLITTRGSVIYVEPTSGELRHGPLESSPANVHLATEGLQARLVYEDFGTLRPILCAPDKCRASERTSSGDRPGEPGTLNIYRFDQRWIALRAEGLFLSAEADGSLTLSRAACREWESFMLSEPLLPHKALAISCVCSANESNSIMAAVAAVERTVRCINADRLYWFSNQPFPNELEGMDIVNVLIPTFTDFCEDINRIYLRLMPEVVTTDFNLTVQPDGFAVNPQSWDDKFWEYDYIGAAWVEKLGRVRWSATGDFRCEARNSRARCLIFKSNGGWTTGARMKDSPSNLITPSAVVTLKNGCRKT